MEPDALPQGSGAQYFEQPKWMPNGIVPLTAPIERQPPEDLRWRPARGPPQLPDQQPAGRTWKAVSDQCRNARVPGYTGFIPSARAEDVYGRTQAAMGDRSVYEQARRMQMRSSSVPGSAGQRQRNSTRLTSAELAASSAGLPPEHPLGRSRADSVNNHWVPTIPGYAGFVPGKHAENICGGGVMQTCKLAGRAIAERGGGPSESMPRPHPEDGLSRSRIVEYFQGRTFHEGEPSQEQVKVAVGVREHCARPIPGYSGHVPRVKGDSVCGATARAANLIAADLAEDRIFNPEAHIRAHCAPQAPGSRKLRL